MHGHETDRGETKRENPPPHLPVQRGKLRISNTAFINAILHIMENGCKRRALPSRFGNRSAACARFRRWSRRGVLDRLFAALRNLHAFRGDAKCFGLGSTSAEGHPDGTGTRKTSGPRSLGKSRGGWCAKIRMVSASDRQGVIFCLSGGHAYDAPEGRALLKSRDKKPAANAPPAMDRRLRGDKTGALWKTGNDADHDAEGEPEGRNGPWTTAPDASSIDPAELPEPDF